ncbi:MAG: endonuclease [Candidatus Cloacimonadota bacterium]|nr:endonuclease [Candidatus Cloacimonadota bacterium]
MKKLFIVLAVFASLGLLAQIPDGYYDDAQGLSGIVLKLALHNIIKDHVEYSYDDLRDFVLKDTDEDPQNTDNVILLYTCRSVPKSTFGGGVDDWNREHVWAKSHGDFGNYPPCGTDAHHIRPTDTSVNSIRGNKDFDYGGSSVYDNGELAGWTDDDSWEPVDEIKGDVARMIMYMAVRYEGSGSNPDLEIVDYVNSAPNGEPFHGKASTLLEWHNIDPVDDWEITRNNKIYSYQENRNPFIDHPEYAALIWPELANEEQLPQIALNMHCYPNPFNPETTIVFNTEETTTVNLSIYNTNGRMIKELYKGSVNNKIEINWNGTDLRGNKVASGIYLISLKTKKGNLTRKAILIK